MSSNAERYPPLVGIIKLQGGLVLQDDKFVKQDLWFDSGLKGIIEARPDEGILYHAEGDAQIIDAQGRFWDAVRYKDYSAHMIFDISGLLAVPGFIDIQTNGAFGLDYTTPPEFDSQGNIKPTALQHIIEKLHNSTDEEHTLDHFESIDPTLSHSTSSTQTNLNLSTSSSSHFQSTTLKTNATSSINATSSVDLQPKPDTSRVGLRTVNKINTGKWSIATTKPIEMSTSLSRSASNSRYSSPNQQQIYSPSNNTPHHHHHHNNFTSPHLSPLYSSSNSNFASPGQIVSTSQFDTHVLNTHFSDGISPSIVSTPASSQTSNFFSFNPSNLPSIPPSLLDVNTLNPFHGNDNLPLITIFTEHTHPHKARTFLNAFAAHTARTSPSQFATTTSSRDYDIDPALRDSLRDSSATLIIFEGEEEITLPTPLTTLDVDSLEQQHQSPEQSQSQLQQEQLSLTTPPLNPKKSIISPLLPNLRTLTSHLTYPFDTNSPITKLLSQRLSLKTLKKFLYTRDPDMLYINERLPKYGVTSICPTIISSDGPTFKSTGERVVQYMLAVENARKLGLIVRQCNMLGLHLEGPFISVSGAHNKTVLGAPKSFQHVSDIYHGNVLFPFTSIVTLAPEMNGALDVTEVLTNRGIVVSMGHSQAGIDDVKLGIERGACLVTHMFNAMRSFHHRDPGLIGVLGATEPHNIHFSIISDGFHAHPFSVNIAYSSSPDKVILVTDSMAAMGLPDGQYKLGTQNVTMYNLKAVLTQQPESLAGAVVSLDQCIRNFVEFTKCPPEHAILAATKTPAQLLGLYPRKGSLLAGADADIVLLEPDTLKVVATIINGQLCFVDGDTFPTRIKPANGNGLPTFFQ